MYEQVSIFDFIEDSSRKEFNPVEEYASRGSGFVGGKERIREFFMKNHGTKEREEFLKDEYGVGGFGMPCYEPFVLKGGSCNRKKNVIEYLDGDLQIVKMDVSYSMLADTISKMIKEERY